MKVLVINSSPKEVKLSTTKTLTERLVEGMEEAGGEVEQFELYRLNLKHCCGCGSCATSMIGKCPLPDDMTNILFPKFLQTDILILSSPVYFGMINAMMKNFIERLYPYLSPVQSVKNEVVEQCFHGELPKTVVVSAASWHYSHAFKQLSDYFRYLFGDKLIGELYRGSSDVFQYYYSGMFEDKRNEILNAAKTAGKEIIINGVVSKESTDIISQDLSDLEKTVCLHNLSMGICQDNQVNVLQYAHEGLENGVRDKIHSIKSFINFMKLLYQKEVNADEFSIQFIFKEDTKGKCYIKVFDGDLKIEEGTLQNPELTISTSYNQFMDIMLSRGNIEKALMNGRILLKGNMSVLEKIRKTFYGG